MDDKEFYEALDRQINDLMKGAKYIALQDIGELNDVLIELSRRRRQYLSPIAKK